MRTPHRWLVPVLALLAGAVPAADTPPADTPAAACHQVVPKAELAAPADRPGPAGLVLEVQASHLRLRRLESPRITATLANRGTDPVRVVLPGEGSRYGLRTPMVSWAIAPAEDPSPAYKPLATGGGPLLCGHIPSLTPRELVTLAPGEEIALEGQVGLPYLGRPGRFRAVLYLENRPRAGWETWRMLAPPDPTAWAGLQESTPFLVASNPIEVTVAD